jgi:uncharacterized membrane-anchored protein YjiN (DUF445 family)
MNMSLATNLISLLLIGVSYLIPPYQKAISAVGYFAFSGAITNWVAIYMLFEKVPGLYGSGVIPNQFEDFKRGIKNMIMTQFFTQENISKFFSQQASATALSPKDLGPIIATIDLEKVFQGLVEIVLASPLGAMLGMFGGPQALQPMKEPFKAKMQQTLTELTQSDEFQSALAGHFGKADMAELISGKVTEIVDQRLSELTPKMVKEIIEEMIQKHLGWLVVWGGVLGGLIGLVMSFFT